MKKIRFILPVFLFITFYFYACGPSDGEKHDTNLALIESSSERYVRLLSANYSEIELEHLHENTVVYPEFTNYTGEKQFTDSLWSYSLSELEDYDQYPKLWKESIKKKFDAMEKARIKPLIDALGVYERAWYYAGRAKEPVIDSILFDQIAENIKSIDGHPALFTWKGMKVKLSHTLVNLTSSESIDGKKMAVYLYGFDIDSDGFITEKDDFNKDGLIIDVQDRAMMNYTLRGIADSYSPRKVKEKRSDGSFFIPKFVKDQALPPTFDRKKIGMYDVMSMSDLTFGPLKDAEWTNLNPATSHVEDVVLSTTDVADNKVYLKDEKYLAGFKKKPKTGRRIFTSLGYGAIGLLSGNPWIAVTSSGIGAASVSDEEVPIYKTNTYKTIKRTYVSRIKSPITDKARLSINFETSYNENDYTVMYLSPKLVKDSTSIHQTVKSYKNGRLTNESHKLLLQITSEYFDQSSANSVVVLQKRTGYYAWYKDGTFKGIYDNIGNNTSNIGKSFQKEFTIPLNTVHEELSVVQDIAYTLRRHAPLKNVEMASAYYDKYDNYRERGITY